MAEWRVVLKHKNGVDRIEIIGIGPDPHCPTDIIKTSRGPIGKKILEEVLNRIYIERDYPSPIIPVFSPDDMYLFFYHLAMIADRNPDWDIEDNLPPLPTEPDVEDNGVHLLI